MFGYSSEEITNFNVIGRFISFSYMFVSMSINYKDLIKNNDFLSKEEITDYLENKLMTIYSNSIPFPPVRRGAFLRAYLDISKRECKKELTRLKLEENLR